MKKISLLIIITTICLEIKSFHNMLRTEKIHFINEYIAPCLKKTNTKNMYKKIIEKYYGIKINKHRDYSSIEMQLNLKTPEIETIISKSELYLFDQKINLLLEEPNSFSNKISNDSIETLCVLSFLLQKILPSTSNKPILNEKEAAFRELLESNEYLFKEISIKTKDQIYKKFIKNLKKNKKYLITMAKFETIEKDVNKKKTNFKQKFKKICYDLPKIKSLEKDFLEFINLKDSISKSIYFILNNDDLYKLSSLYILFSEQNLEKIQIDNNKKEICKEIYKICELILKNLSKIFGTKHDPLKTIKINHLNVFIVENIIRNIAFFGYADKFLGGYFKNAYYYELNSILNSN